MTTPPNHLQTVPENMLVRCDSHNSDSSFSHLQPPSPIITRRTRTRSVSERAAQGPALIGRVKYFCRQRGHGYITPIEPGDDIFVHVTDIDGEFVPHEGDEVVYKLCPLPPKFDRYQAVHVQIKNLAPGVHERWDQPPSPHQHPHPAPNTPETRHPHPDFADHAPVLAGGATPPK